MYNLLWLTSSYTYKSSNLFIFSTLNGKNTLQRAAAKSIGFNLIYVALIYVKFESPVSLHFKNVLTQSRLIH
jgi:hypothetical protein